MSITNVLTVGAVSFVYRLEVCSRSLYLFIRSCSKHLLGPSAVAGPVLASTSFMAAAAYALEQGPCLEGPSTLFHALLLESSNS